MKQSYYIKEQVQKSAESGRSMVEMLGVIGIIIVITSSVMVGVQSAWQVFRASQAKQTIEEVGSNVQELYSWARRNPYASLSMDTICDNVEIACSDGGFSTPFGHMTIESRPKCAGKDDADCGQGFSLIIDEPSLSVGTCNQLVNNLSSDVFTNVVIVRDNGSDRNYETSWCFQGGNGCPVHSSQQIHQIRFESYIDAKFAGCRNDAADQIK